LVRFAARGAQAARRPYAMKGQGVANRLEHPGFVKFGETGHNAQRIGQQIILNVKRGQYFRDGRLRVVDFPRDGGKGFYHR
jgi:hypothetical protein